MFKKFFLFFSIFTFFFNFFFAKTKKEKTIHEKIVVTATAFKEDPLQIIDSFSLLSNEKIKQAMPFTLTEALTLSSSNLSLTGGGYGQFSSVFLRGASSKHILLMINGIKINDPASLSLDFSPFSPFAFRQIEIVEGPQSSLYGSESMGGAINLITPKKEAFQISLFGGKNSSFGGNFLLGKKIGKGILSLNYNGSSIRGDFENSDFENQNLSIGWKFSSSSFSFAPFYYLVKNKTEIPFNFGLPSPNRKANTEVQIFGFPIKMNMWKENYIEFSLGAYRRDYSLDDPDAFWSKYYHTKSDNYQINTKAFFFFLSKKSPSLLGFEILKSTIFEENEFSITFKSKKYNSYALFGEQIFRYKNFTSVVGIRYDKYHSFDSTLSPKFTASYKFTSGDFFFIPFFVLSKGFRAPKLSEYASPWGTPDLKPEISKNIEGGLKIADDNTFIRFSYFNTDYENLIVFDYLTYKLKNSEKDRISGFSVSFQRKLFGKNSFSLSFVKLKAENIKTGEKLLRRPDFQIKGNLFLSFGKFDVFLFGRYIGKRRDYDEKNFSIVDAESFSVFNLNIKYKISKQFSLFLKINNLFDKDYYEIYGYPSPQRWLLGGLNFNF